MLVNVSKKLKYQKNAVFYTKINASQANSPEKWATGWKIASSLEQK